MMAISLGFKTFPSLSVYYSATEGGGGVGFDSAETDARDEDGDDQATEGGVGVPESRKSSDTSENYVASPRREISMNSGR